MAHHKLLEVQALQVLLGKRIRELRLKRGFSQESFADHCGLHRTALTIASGLGITVFLGPPRPPRPPRPARSGNGENGPTGPRIAHAPTTWDRDGCKVE